MCRVISTIYDLLCVELDVKLYTLTQFMWHSTHARIASIVNCKHDRSVVFLHVLKLATVVGDVHGTIFDSISFHDYFSN